MSANSYEDQLAALKHKLEHFLKSEGVPIPRFAPTPDDDVAQAAQAADAERADYLPAMDKAMGLERLTPQARLEGSTLRCGCLPEPEPTTTQRTVAPQQPVSRPATQRTLDAAAEAHAAELRAMDAAMGIEPKRGVRREGNRLIFQP